MIDTVFLKRGKYTHYSTENHLNADEPYTPPYWEYESAIYRRFHGCITDSLFGVPQENLQIPVRKSSDSGELSERTTYSVCQQDVFNICKHDCNFLCRQKR